MLSWNARVTGVQLPSSVKLSASYTHFWLALWPAANWKDIYGHGAGVDMSQRQQIHRVWVSSRLKAGGISTNGVEYQNTVDITPSSAPSMGPMCALLCAIKSGFKIELGPIRFSGAGTYIESNETLSSNVSWKAKPSRVRKALPLESQTAFSCNPQRWIPKFPRCFPPSLTRNEWKSSRFPWLVSALAPRRTSPQTITLAQLKVRRDKLSGHGE